MDTKALEDELAYGDLYEAIERQVVHSEEPLEMMVTVELNGDRLDVTLDDEATVIEVTERVREPA